MRTWIFGLISSVCLGVLWWSAPLDAKPRGATPHPTATAIHAHHLLGDYLFVARTFRDHTPNKNHLTCQRCPTFVNEFAPSIGAGISYAPTK